MNPQRIARLLPECYREEGALDPARPLGCLLAVMDAMHAPVERLVETLGDYVDPYAAPADFVFLLAGWLGLAPYLHLQGARRNSGQPHYAAGLFNLRLLVAAAPALHRARGTAGTLERFLGVATGLSGFAVEDADRPFHLRVTAPAIDGARAELIRTIVREMRPAFVTYELHFAEPAPAPPNPEECPADA